VATVAGKPIRLGEIRHLMVIGNSGQPLPDPPSYASCVAKEKAALAAKASEGAGTQQSEAQLRQVCQEHYEKLLQSALSKAIHTRWLLGEAAEERIDVSPEEVLREFDEGRKSFKSNAEFEKYRKSTGQSITDMLGELKTGKVADAIFKRIKAKEHAATSAEVAAYYNAHRQKYAIPEGRDVRIVRTTTKAGALNALKELRAGKSFAEVAKQLTEIGQPIGAEHGIVKGLLPGVFEEKSLNDPIFAAQLHHLYGPLQITAQHKTIAPETNSGYFIFEVTGLVPARQTPLSRVKGEIAASLTEAQKNQTLSGFILAFRARWKARTDCRAGYVVRNCKQFTGGPKKAEDPYTL
jgi:foldase protein PrsA